jgi:hypothetical protein
MLMSLDETLMSSGRMAGKQGEGFYLETFLFSYFRATK